MNNRKIATPIIAITKFLFTLLPSNSIYDEVKTKIKNPRKPKKTSKMKIKILNISVFCLILSLISS